MVMLNTGGTSLGPVFPSDLMPLDSGLGDLRAGRAAQLSRWMGWRLRLLVGAALAGCLALFLLTQGMAEQPHIDAVWRGAETGRLELTATSDPALAPHIGRRWRARPPAPSSFRWTTCSRCSVRRAG